MLADARWIAAHRFSQAARQRDAQWSCRNSKYLHEYWKWFTSLQGRWCGCSWSIRVRERLLRRDVAGPEEFVNRNRKVRELLGVHGAHPCIGGI